MIMKVFPLAYLFIALALVFSTCDAQTPIQQNFHLFSDSSCTDLIGVGSYYSDSDCDYSLNCALFEESGIYLISNCTALHEFPAHPEDFVVTLNSDSSFDQCNVTREMLAIKPDVPCLDFNCYYVSSSSCAENNTFVLTIYNLPDCTQIRRNVTYSAECTLDADQGDFITGQCPSPQTPMMEPVADNAPTSGNQPSTNAPTASPVAAPKSNTPSKSYADLGKVVGFLQLIIVALVMAL